MPTIFHRVLNQNVSYRILQPLSNGTRPLDMSDIWEKENIIRVKVPQLAGVDDGTSGGCSGVIKFHKAGAYQLQRAFAEIEARGLKRLILSFAGSYYPRMIRGSTTVPSEHCLPASEMVWTPDGAKSIGDMKYYMGLVWAYENGQAVARRVTNFFDNGEKPIVKVNCSGHSFRCTPDHPVLVMKKETLPKGEWIQHPKGRGQQRARYGTEWVLAGDLKPGDRVVALRSLAPRGIETVDGDWAETLGLFMGDGCVGHRKGDPVYVSFSIPRADRIRSHAVEVLSRCMGEAPKISDVGLIYYKSHIRARFEAYDKKAREKTIPPEVWRWTEECQLRFVLGYLYSDGCIIKSASKSGGGYAARYAFKAASPQLIQDLKLLLTGLGFQCSRITETKSVSMVICGVPTQSNGDWSFKAIDVRGVLKPDADPVYREMVAGAVTPQQGSSHCYGYEAVGPDFTHRVVQSVQPDGFERVYDITIEGLHNFITDGVVVSNSFGTALDINAAWNGLNRTPAAAGTKGSVRELVPSFERWGFRWGGNFRRRDGMHVEISRLISAQEIAPKPAQQVSQSLIISWNGVPFTVEQLIERQGHTVSKVTEQLDIARVYVNSSPKA